MLDEAMAGSMAGDCCRLETVVYNCCSMLTACHRAGDSERATQWCRVADEFMREYSCPFLFARCRVHYGSLLLTKGRWTQAEKELRAALQMAEDAGPTPKVEALTGLAELRLGQGRLEEAEELAGCDDTGAAALVAAQLRLAQGRPMAAVALLQRRLARVGEKPVEAVPALACLVNAHVVRGDVDSAEEAAARLDTLAQLRRGEDAAALSASAWARVLTARGRVDEAVARAGGSARSSLEHRLPLQAAQVRLELASALAAQQPDAAVSEAHSALKSLRADRRDRLRRPRRIAAALPWAAGQVRHQERRRADKSRTGGVTARRASVSPTPR